MKSECLTKECIDDYLVKLEQETHEYMAMPINTRNVEAIESMIRCYNIISGLNEMREEDIEGEITREEAEHWNSMMMNADGTSRGHWTIYETNEVDKPKDVPDYVWNVVMNMMYSDYYQVATKYGTNSPYFYADLARAFLNDNDAVVNKVNAYYVYIVK